MVTRLTTRSQKPLRQRNVMSYWTNSRTNQAPFAERKRRDVVRLVALDAKVAVGMGTRTKTPNIIHKPQRLALVSKVILTRSGS